MKHKDQHIIPTCYLRAWCDPHTPAGHTSFIWRITKDGTTKKKKSPEKSFTANNRYTIRLLNGQRDLTVEHTLGNLETQFVHVLQRIRRLERLNIRDRVRLCMFTAAMHSRTKAMADHWRTMWEQVHRQVLAMEQQRNAKPGKSLEMAEMIDRTNPDLVMVALEIQTPMYLAMQMSILVTNDDVGFITSDTPCVWRNPKAHILPPGMRSAVPGDPEVEISLPISPQHLLLLSHIQRPFYVDVPQATVDLANAVILDFCSEEFVSWKGLTRPEWFAVPEPPQDAWENTAEGKRAIAEHEKTMQWQRDWELRQGTKKS